MEKVSGLDGIRWDEYKEEETVRLLVDRIGWE